MARVGVDGVRASVTFQGIEAVDATLGRGDDAFTGNAGANLIAGRGGRDVIDMGDAAARDPIVVAAPDSTGAGRDLVRGFDAKGEDAFAPPVRVDALRGIAGGTLSAATFDAGLARTLDAPGQTGGAREAWLWFPSAGGLDRPGVGRVMVGMNDDGLFRRGADIVIEMEGWTGTLDAGDLIL